MKTSDFDYRLPAELIAQQPLPDRAASRMLVINRQTDELQHDHFRNLGQHLHPGDRLVLNDTKVIPARIWATAPPVELLLVEDLGENHWTALVRPGYRAKVGTRLKFTPWFNGVVERETDFGRVIRFEGNVESFLKHHGAPPLPPYIERPAVAADRDRYQTVFARQPGAIAAPTAGLHFTPELLAALQAAGIPHTFVTLHVGLATFRPVKTETVEDHPMHAERFSVPAATVSAIRAVREDRDDIHTGRKGRIIAVGTTVVRTLETIAPSLPHSRTALTGTTNLFIRPPFEFRVVDAMLTNFHLPRSTLLMLVSAFAGPDLIRLAYTQAIRERYRFYSYGDCMLIL